MVAWGKKKYRKTDEEHDENCVKEGFQLVRAKFDRDGERSMGAAGMGYCSTNI